MDGSSLISFPLPILTALLCGGIAVLVWQLELGLKWANILFSALFGLFAFEALLVGLRFGYGAEALTPLQRVVPLFLGPMMYLGFASAALAKRRFARVALLHMGTPVIIMALFTVMVKDLRHFDWVIGGSYLFYLVALYLLWRKGPDALIHARVDVTRRFSELIVWGMGLLAFILVMDTAIAIDFARNRGVNAAALISYGNIPLIAVLIVTLFTLPVLLSRSRRVAAARPVSNAGAVEIEARLRKLMKEERLFLDPDLTVQRLARRLHVPARNLSVAINGTQGMNISQYVNEFRLAHAADMLERGDESVIDIAAQSGFMTRSNFYREFQRVHGQSPAAYRNVRRSARKPAAARSPKDWS